MQCTTPRNDDTQHTRGSQETMIHGTKKTTTPSKSKAPSNDANTNDGITIQNERLVNTLYIYKKKKKNKERKKQKKTKKTYQE